MNCLHPNVKPGDPCVRVCEDCGLNLFDAPLGFPTFEKARQMGFTIPPAFFLEHEYRSCFLPLNVKPKRFRSIDEPWEVS